jgi:PII-like signaling protein
MLEDGLRLTAYIGERDRVGGRLLADALLDVYARHGLRTSALLRGIEGFGIKHRLHTERLLTLSEDLPLLALALDTPARIEAVLDEVRALSRHGAITLERARLAGGTGLAAVLASAPRGAGSVASGSVASGSVTPVAVTPVAGASGPAVADHDALKLTLFVGRQERVAGRAAYAAVVECLYRHGVAGASVLLGLDGTVHGERRRARFFASNARVPLMIQSVGERASIAAALEELAVMLAQPALTLERVRVCKRDGVTLARPHSPPVGAGSGLAYWQKLVVYASEQSRYERQPLHSALIHRLRLEGAAGATALRGMWGYHGAHRPHGEALWSLRRHVPVLTLLLDTPENMVRWYEIVDQMTGATGLVTSEVVPALRAAGPGIEHGGLALAARSTL